jgi:hypothetical protein
MLVHIGFVHDQVISLDVQAHSEYQLVIFARDLVAFPKPFSSFIPLWDPKQTNKQN